MSTWIPACQTDDVEPEDIIPFEHSGHQYAIYQSGDGDYYATDGHCTHERELLCEGLVMGKTIECPKHNGRFEYATGRAMGAPVIVDLRTYAVKVEDDTVYIEVD